MISVIPGHRRADAFAAAVEGREGRHAGAHAELLEVVDAMRGVETPTPRPEFVASLREQLMAEADVALSETEARLALPAPIRRGRDRRLAVAAGALAVVAGTGSVAVASQGALPGDTLYPVKRALESAQTSLTMGDDAKATRVLGNANDRLDEIERLAARFNSESNPEAQAALPDSLSDFAQQADQAAGLKIAEFETTGDTKPIAQLREFTANGIDKLSLLNTMLPPQALDSLQEAVQTLTEIDSRATALCPGCGDVLELPQNLVSVMRASHASPKQGEQDSTTLADALTDTKPQSGNDHPALPTVDPNMLVPIDLGNGDLDGADQDADTPASHTPTRGGKHDGTAKEITKNVEKTVKDGRDHLIGKKGPLKPLNPLLDPLLDPVIGDGGLLDP